MRIHHPINNQLTLACMLLWCFCFSAGAQNTETHDTLVVRFDAEPFEFLFDETITKIGSDFFRMFYGEWENTSLITGLSIYIGEKPMPGMGTRIWVKVEDRYTFMAFVRPNLEQLRQSVKIALEQTQSYFINYETIQKDLESEDYSGTGLF